MDDRTRADLVLLENLKIEEKILSERIKETQRRVLSVLSVGTTIEAEEGTFSISQKSKWRYTPELEAREKAVKEDQKREQQTGAAQETKGDPFLTYRSSKEDDKEDDV